MAQWIRYMVFLKSKSSITVNNQSLKQALWVFNLELENREGENLDQPVHILVLVSVEGSPIFHPADGGFGYTGGLAGQGGLNVDCDCHVGAAVSDGRRDWKRRTKDHKITGWLCSWVIESIHVFCMHISTVPPTIYLQIHSLALRSSLICCHAQVAASVGHLSRVDV